GSGLNPITPPSLATRNVLGALTGPAVLVKSPCLFHRPGYKGNKLPHHPRRRPCPTTVADRDPRPYPDGVPRHDRERIGGDAVCRAAAALAAGDAGLPDGVPGATPAARSGGGLRRRTGLQRNVAARGTGRDAATRRLHGPFPAARHTAAAAVSGPPGPGRRGVS